MDCYLLVLHRIMFHPNIFKVFPGLIMLRKICNHPDLTSTAGSLDWMKATKQANEANSIEGKKVDESDFEDGYGFWKRSGKLIVVESLLKLWKGQKHRVLLFSQTRQVSRVHQLFPIFSRG